MLIEFSAENFRSIRERVTLSMIAAKLRARDAQLDRDNIIAISEKLALLRSSVIYGANSSGKSNIIKAFGFMRRFVRDSARQQDEDTIPVEPFRLNTTTVDKPSTFEAIFLLDGHQYRYGFSLTTEHVVAEWLYFIPTSREVALFTRDKEGIHIGSSFREGRGLEGLNLDMDNKLFLSVVAQLKKQSETAKRVRQWFISDCRILKTVSDEGYLPYTLNCIENGLYHNQIESLTRLFDLDITRLSVEETPLPGSLLQLQDISASAQNRDSDEGEKMSIAVRGVTPNRTLKELHTRHAIRDDNGHTVAEADFPANSMESEGTQKIIALFGPLLDVLTHGRILFLDEIDSRLHPVITAAIVRLFNSPETNPKNAQLICVTHDTNLLDRHLLRRDQIFFVEKDEKSASHLYSLADFKLESPEGTAKKIRNDADFEKNYIQGRYGAIPYLGAPNELFVEEFRREEETEAGITSHEAVQRRVS